MKRILLLVGLVLLISIGACAQDSGTALGSKPKEIIKRAESKGEAPSVSEKVGLKIRTEQLAQSRIREEYATLERQLEETPVGKRLKELTAKFQESLRTMQDAAKGVCGDERVWTLDFEALNCVPTAKLEAAKAAEPKKTSPQ